MHVLLRTLRLLRAALATLIAGTAGAAEWQHALGHFDEFRYAPDFTHFDWVNPDAPKGGEIRVGVAGTFDSFNALVPRGKPAAGLAVRGSANWLYDRLMEPTADELATWYGRLAEAVLVADDRSAVTFRLRAGAHWHDGVPISAGDVRYALEVIRAHGDPALRVAYTHVDSVEVLDARHIRFGIAPAGRVNRNAILELAELHPLPEHWWTAPGSGRDPARMTIEPPLGSGPYRIGAVRVGRAVSFERVPDYWGRDLPVNRGRFNFDRITYDHFVDHYVGIQAQIAGAVDVRVETTARLWETAYDVEAARRGHLVRDMARVEVPTGAGWGPYILNLRLAKFADVRVREALWWARDFPWANRVLSWDVYVRSESYFSGTPFAQSGLPGDDELALLEPLRDAVPSRVFTDAYRSPASRAVGPDRDGLLHADALLREAGFVVRDGRRVDARSGEPLTIAILYSNHSAMVFNRPYHAALERLGIATTARVVEASQYLQRLRGFDFELTLRPVAPSMIPNSELQNLFGSAAAHQPLTANVGGIADPAVDALIGRVVGAGSMRELTAAVRALDRVLLWNFYMVPGYYPPGIMYVYWNRFGQPRRAGIYRTGYPDTWWFDAERARRIEAGEPIDDVAPD